MTVYRLFFVIDVAALFLALYFFFAGIGDGSVSSFNILLWLAFLAGMTAVIGAGYSFQSRGRTSMATGILGIVTAPAVLASLFLLSILIAQPNWN